MTCLVISGSRNPEGQTAQATNAVCTGLTSAGVECSTVYLPTEVVERCRQCDDDGWGICKSEGRCIIDGTPAIGVCVAGGGGGGGPSCCASLEKVLRTIGFDVFDIAPVRRQNLEAKHQSLSELGAAFARNYWRS